MRADSAGEHLLLTIEKRGMNTAFAARRIAAWAGVDESAIGYAGMKDRHAVTRQRFTVWLPKKVAPDVSIPLIVWLKLRLDQLIRYANGNFVLVYLLCMAAGWRLLGGMGKGLAGVSVLLCAVVLVALASQVLYAVVLSAGYGCFSLWRRRRRRSASGERVCAIK